MNYYLIQLIGAECVDYKPMYQTILARTETEAAQVAEALLSRLIIAYSDYTVTLLIERDLLQ